MFGDSQNCEEDVKRKKIDIQILPYPFFLVCIKVKPVVFV